MKAGWKTVKLGEVADIYNGNTIPDKEKKRLLELPNPGLPFIATKDVGFDGVVDYENGINIPKDEALDFKVAKADAVLVCAEGGSAGRKIGHINRDVHFGNKLFALNATPAINPRYLYHFCQSENFRKKFKALMAGLIGGVSVAKFKLIEIPLPPLAEQKRIVALLDEAFAGIDEAKAKAEKSLRDTKTLMESHLEAAFTRRDRDWKDKTLSELCERITKGSSPKWQGISYVKTPGVLFVTSENVGENEIMLDAPKYVEEKFNLKDKKSILKSGDVLTNIVGASIGRTAVFNRNDPANINQAVCLLRCRPDSLNNHYLAYLLNSPVFKRLLHDNEINTARANLSLSFFSKLLVPVPPLLKQNQIVSTIETFRKQAEQISKLSDQKLAALFDLRESVLSQAFAGELTA